MQDTKFSADCEIFSPRWGHNDTYTFSWTPEGWSIVGGGGHKCSVHIDEDGTEPSDAARFERMLANDMMFMPWDMHNCLWILWKGIRDGEIDDDVANAEIAKLGNWINATTESAPRGGPIGEYYGRRD